MTEFKFGDRVMHAGRPEWGTGVVTAAQRVELDGKAVQRVTLRFDRAGLKTLASPPADLRAADAPSPASAVVAEEQTTENEGWLAEAERSGVTPAEIFSKLPEACSDPFASLSARIEATLKLYRFDSSGASLLDWAATATGLADPLAEFARPELEQHFPRFVQAREEQLRSLLREVRETDIPAIREIVANALPAAREAVKRLYGSR